MAHGVLHQRLHREHGHDRGQHLGRDAHPHVEPVAEARLLEPQVLLDVVQLVGQRHVGAVAAERVAGELGELGQQLARLLGLRVDRVRDRGERVVDEVRRDLRPQRPQLGLRQPLLLRGQERQLDLRADQRRDLASPPACPPAAAAARCRRTPRAARSARPARPAARPPCARTGSGPCTTATRSESGSQSRPSPAGSAVGGEHLAARVDHHARRLRERVQVPDRLARRLARQPAAQVRERRRRRVQRGAHALLAGREHPPRRRQPAHRQRRSGEHDAEQHPEQDVHPASISPLGTVARRSAPGGPAGDAGIEQAADADGAGDLAPHAADERGRRRVRTTSRRPSREAHRRLVRRRAVAFHVIRRPPPRRLTRRARGRAGRCALGAV